MKSFDGSVAIVTGGASGLGLALAKAAQSRGCKLVIADIRDDALAEAERELSKGGEVLTVKTDVSKSTDIDAMTKAAVDRFGKVNLLFNNAGVFASGLAWETSEEEYDWVIGVNQRSVSHGIRSIVPTMIKQADPCHVITISSGAGISVNPGFCTYSMTKHAVVALTEALYLDLATQGIDNIGVTIAMPGMAQSGIMAPEKASPDALSGELGDRLKNPVLNSIEQLMRAGVNDGMPAAELAETIFGAIEKDELYVLPAFTDEDSLALTGAIGMGRSTGQNPYPAILEGLMASLEEMKNAAQGGG